MTKGVRRGERLGLALVKTWSWSSAISSAASAANGCVRSSAASLKFRPTLAASSMNPIEGRVSAAQSHIILRILFGVLLEAWNVICTNKPIIDRYMPEIDDDGQKSYKTLEEYFQKSSLLYKLRNNFAYHLPNAKVVEKAFNSIPKNEDWEWYLSSHNTNSFYFSCELIMGYGMLNLARNKTSP